MRFAPERRLLRVVSFRPRQYWWGSAAWLLFFFSPIVPGWLIGQIFDELQSGRTTARAWWLLATLAAAEVGIVLMLAIGHRTYVQGNDAARSLLKANVMHAQVASGGSRAAARNVPIGDVLVRLRDDPQDLIFLIDNWLDFTGSLIYSAAAAYFLVRIDPLAAIAGIAPLLLSGWGNMRIASLARRFRERSRTAASAVSEFLAAAFEASLTVKVAGAQKGVLARLDRLNSARTKASVGDNLWNDVMWTVNGTVGDIFVGLALLVAARGSLSAGEVSQFASYLLGLVWLPMRIGGVVAGRRRYEVSAGRVDALLASRPTSDGVDPMTEYRSLPLLGGPQVPPPQRAERVPLRTLDVRGLTVESRGLREIDLHLERGTLTIVSGRVGSGKTSLLRAVLGLVVIDGGEVRWNDELIDDRAAFFIPPQAAYVAQVPRLFAESLADNLRLSHSLDDTDLDAAIRLAVFDADVAELPEGLSTTVGARGVRLSGGQVQRAAGARAIAHRPELLVLDDLTSALDVETEVQLWTGLAAAGYTVLAASNRPVALSRADQVIELG